MMEMTTAKTVAVFAIIIGCFVILYPKIFHPMILHIFGMAPAKRSGDDLSTTRVPPHLRQAMASGKHGSARDDLPGHMRAGGHPGMRAAAEMKKAAMQQSTTGDKGMMGVVLPMYAVGIVLYLLYTLSKVFNRKGKDESSPNGTSGDYLSNHFSDMLSKSTPSNSAASAERQAMQKQKELEKLLMKAENEDINDNEMSELKRRLIETEAQMSRILQAMEVVQQKVCSTTGPGFDNGAVDDDSLNPAAGIEEVHDMSHDDRSLDDEADCLEDDSDGGSVDELNLDELEQGDEDEVDEIEQQACVKPLPGTIRLPPPADLRRNYASLADEFGKTSAEQGSYNEVELVETIDGTDIQTEKWKEGNVRHRTGVIKSVE